MNERFIYLIEKYFDSEQGEEEKKEFESLLLNNELKEEFEEQKRIKEVLTKMKLKNPSTEVWDNYWLGIYNKFERGIAWIAVSVGFIILLVYGSIEAVENESAYDDNSTAAGRPHCQGIEREEVRVCEESGRLGSSSRIQHDVKINPTYTSRIVFG